MDLLLAAGADIAASPELAIRARQLTSRRERRQIARSIDELLRRDDWAFAVAVPGARASLHAATTELGAARARLLGPGPVYAQGVARLEVLLRDGAGPLFGGEPDSARAAARDACRALWGG